MYAVAFDLKTEGLETSREEAYDEIGGLLKDFGFERIHAGFYVAAKAGITTIYEAVNKLSQVNWFKESVRDIRVFKVEDWSDFTDVVKGLDLPPPKSPRPSKKRLTK